MTFYHTPRGCPALAADKTLGYPLGPKIHEKCTCAETCAKGGAEDGPREAMVGKSAPKVTPGIQNRGQNGGKMKVKPSLRARFYRKWPTMLLTHYLLCITHIGPLQFHSFLAPGGTKSRFKMASPFSTTKKPAEIVSVVPQRRPMVPTWGPKGSPRPPKCLPKVAQNHQKMWTCLRGDPQRSTRSPKVPQIDKIRRKTW